MLAIYRSSAGKEVERKIPQKAACQNSCLVSVIRWNSIGRLQSIKMDAKIYVGLQAIQAEVVYSVAVSMRCSIPTQKGIKTRTLGSLRQTANFILASVKKNT